MGLVVETAGAVTGRVHHVAVFRLLDRRADAGLGRHAYRHRVNLRTFAALLLCHGYFLLSSLRWPFFFSTSAFLRNRMECSRASPLGVSWFDIFLRTDS